MVKRFFHNWKSRLCKFLSTIYLLTPTSLYMYEQTIYSSFHQYLIFLNFNFNGSALLFGRPAVNAIHFKNPPVPLQVSFVIFDFKVLSLLLLI